MMRDVWVSKYVEAKIRKKSPSDRLDLAFVQSDIAFSTKLPLDTNDKESIRRVARDILPEELYWQVYGDEDSGSSAK